MRRLTILFVDADSGAQAKIRQILEKEFTVLCVGSIKEARASLQRDVPDILISEALVGQESGLELCRYVRDNVDLRPMAVMLLTSLSTLSDKVAGFDAGTDDYVIKPFDAHHLQARIRLLTRIKRLERRLHV